MRLRFCLGLAIATLDRAEAATAAGEANRHSQGAASGLTPPARPPRTGFGALHTLAAATPLVASSGSASGDTLAANSPVLIVYTVDGTANLPFSWTITGTIPPGLNFSGLTSPGTVNVDNATPPYLVLSGTPTAAGTYPLTLQAWEGENASEVNSPLYSTTKLSCSPAQRARRFSPLSPRTRP